MTLADPAMGTGAYLLGALRHIAATVEDDMGPGAVPSAIAAATQRLIGFEMQFGPFAVAQLRLIAEIQTLMSISDSHGGNLPDLKLYVTDTLGDPYAVLTQFPSMTAAIGESRRQANRIKREEKITVVIGNPPYKIDAAAMGGWIENGSDTNKTVITPIQRWVPPATWGLGAHTKHLKNLYVYFWRWATLKVFGSGWQDVTQEPERDGRVSSISLPQRISEWARLQHDARRPAA